MRAVEAFLAELLGSPGTVGAVLADAVTGLEHGALGEHRPLGAGAELAELAALVGEGLGAAGAAGELESVVITTARHHQVVRLIPRQGDPLLLAVLLDRTRTNLALAIRRSTDEAEDLLA
ncbi:hypothetical protein ACIQBJ_17770 [Kitasatospora sp. NPDC088391]|uniref:hypothetical protein n=1 Tax=Kitasatospora sp. NPDC088391 TaxID=3364074 RepID=UPI0038131FFD